MNKKTFVAFKGLSDRDGRLQPGQCHLEEWNHSEGVSSIHIDAQKGGGGGGESKTNQGIFIIELLLELFNLADQESYEKILTLHKISKKLFCRP